MTIRNLEHLLAPRSVVLVGASDRPGSVGAILAANLAKGGFKGPVWLVNPRCAEIGGQACYPTVDALPGVPDLAVIATPPDTILGLIDALGAKGCRAAVVITAGVKGDIRDRMLAAAGTYTLRVQGPNCIGLMVPGIGLDASFCHRAPLPGQLAFVSQSGALVTGIIDWTVSRGIGFSHVVSIGDKADVDSGDLLDYLAGDTKSRAILIYLESLKNARKFMSAARRAARSKPVIVIKSGRHAAGARAAMSHTGALAGSDAAFAAAFRRAGLLRVNELEDLFEGAEMVSRISSLSGERLAILTNGGGAGVLAADRLADLDGSMAELSRATRAALDAALPPTWSRGNPIDIIGDAPPERYAVALEHVLADPGVDAVVVVNCPTALAPSLEAARAVTDTIERRRKAGQPSKPVIATWLGVEAARPSHEHFARHLIPSFATPSAAIDGFMQLVRYTRAQTELMVTPPSVPGGLGGDRETAAAVIAKAAAERRTTLTEIEAKAVLAAYRVPVAATGIAIDPAAVARLAAPIIAEHGACVVKILSPDITHKSDIGGVRLGLASPAEAEAAARAILERARAARPQAHIIGFAVQPMIRRPRAHELILGVAEDATFGPVVMFGAGGVAVEAMRDIAHALPPLDMRLATDLMQQTRIMRLLKGFRDRPAADLDAIAATLVQLSALVADHDAIREIDINPLLADESGVIVLDARIRIGAASDAPRTPMAIRPYPREWEKAIAIEGVGQVELRPIRPDDERLYAEFFSRVSAADMRMRFFTPRADISHRFLARLTQIDYAREMAFVALDPADGHLLGVARLIADPDYQRAEYAVLVRTDLKGKGLGWALMSHLVDYARASGLPELFGHVLADNTTMLSMCEGLGFDVRADPEDPSLRIVTLDVTRAP